MSMGSSHSLLYRTSVALAVEDPPELAQQPVGVPLDDLLRQPRPGLGLSARVPDARGEVPNDEHRRVPRVLEVPELPQHHGPAERHGRRGRVEAELHPQGPPEPELGPELIFGNDFGGAREQPIHVGSSHDRG